MMATSEQEYYVALINHYLKNSHNRLVTKTDSGPNIGNFLKQTKSKYIMKRTFTVGQGCRIGLKLVRSGVSRNPVFFSTLLFKFLARPGGLTLTQKNYDLLLNTIA